MPQVRMPTGEIVNMPDNPTPEQIAALEQLPVPKTPPSGMVPQFVQGLDVGTKHVQQGVKQLLGRDVTGEVNASRVEDAPLQATAAGGTGAVLGEAAPGLAAQAALGMTLGPAGNLFGTLARTGAIGMASGALDPVGSPDPNGQPGNDILANPRANNMLAGTAGGLAGGLLGHGVSRVIAPSFNPQMLKEFSADKVGSMLLRGLMGAGGGAVSAYNMGHTDKAGMMAHIGGGMLMANLAPQVGKAVLGNRAVQAYLTNATPNLAPYLGPTMGALGSGLFAEEARP